MIVNMIVLVAGGLIILVAIAGGLFWVLSERARRKSAKRTWQAAAVRLRGAYVPYRSQLHGLSATLLDTSVRVEQYDAVIGHGRLLYVRAIAAVPNARSLAMEVLRKDVLSGLGSAIGMQDVATGQVDFDQTYTVKAVAPELVPIWIGPAECSAIRAAGINRLELRDGRVAAYKLEDFPSEDALVNMAVVAATLAARGHQLLGIWCETARALGGTVQTQHAGSWVPDGQTRISLVHASVPMSIDVISEEQGRGRVRVLTRVWAQWQRVHEERYLIEQRDLSGHADGLEAALPPDPAFAARFRVYSSQPARTVTRLTPSLVRGLCELPPLRVVAGGDHVVLSVAGAVMTPDRLWPVVQALASLCRGETGPYR